MPTNVTAEYLAAEQEFLKAKTREEKILALQKMISYCPKHKGTENLLKGLKSRLAKLKKEEKEEKKGGRSRGISKEGDAQVFIIGLTNTGKSYLLKTLTNASPKISDYEYTTTDFLQGMMDYGGAKIQIIDTPPIIPNNDSNNRRILGTSTSADGFIIIGKNYEDIKQSIKILESFGYCLNKEKPEIVVKKNPEGIRVIGGELVKGISGKRLLSILNDIGIKNKEIIIKKECELEDLISYISGTRYFKKAIFIINTKGKEVDDQKMEIRRKNEENIIVGDIKSKKELIRDKIWEMLSLVRIYTKEQGEDPNREKPLVLHSPAKVQDVAEALHKEFVKKFKYARIWGKSAKFPAQKVGLDHELRDGDVIEIHTR